MNGNGILVKMSLDKSYKRIKSFLDENYLHSKTLNTLYPLSLLRWILKESVIVGMFDKYTKKMLGMIAGRELDIIENGLHKKVIEVNFLSVLEAYRNLGIAKILRLGLQNYFSNNSLAFYTTSYPLKNQPFCISSIKYLDLKSKCDLYRGKQSDLRKMTAMDIPQVVKLMNDITYNVSFNLDKKFLFDLLDSPIETFVSVTPTNKVTGFVSWFTLGIRNNSTRQMNYIAQLYYYSDPITLNKLLILLCNKYPQISELRCIGTGPSSSHFLNELGFKTGDQVMYYNLYNVNTSNESSNVPNFYNPSQVNLLMI